MGGGGSAEGSGQGMRRDTPPTDSRNLECGEEKRNNVGVAQGSSRRNTAQCQCG